MKPYRHVLVVSFLLGALGASSLVLAEDGTTTNSGASTNSDATTENGHSADRGSDPAYPLPDASVHGFGLSEPLPEVLSATRLRQPKAQAPATVTILRGELLKNLGVTTLWEAFRLVPGMTLGYVESNVPVVSYHGTVANDQRRLQVLVDGRAMYNPNLADVDWHNIPVALENIDRIEVIRGPNAAAYGVNAFLATINIITKSPQDTHGSYAHIVGGYNDRERYFASHGGEIGRFDWRLSYLKRIDDGFDKRCRGDEEDCDHPAALTEVADDGYNIETVNLRSQLQLNPDMTLTFNAGYNGSYEEVDPEQYGREFGFQDRPDIEGEDYYGQLQWEQDLSPTHSYKLQAYYTSRNRVQEWRSCVDPSALPILPFAFCADVNQNITESRFDIEFQDTLTLTPELRLVSGLSYRRDRFESDTFFNGKGENHLYRVFGNVEATPVDWATINLGAMWEDERSGEFLSPRAALNLHFTPYQTLRFIVSKAYRTPDTFEQSADWAFRANNVGSAPSPELAEMLEDQRLFAGARGLGTLKEEKIVSREISYYGVFPLDRAQLSVEVKVFRDSISDLITGFLSYDNWDVNNYVSSEQKGFEVEAALNWAGDLLRLTYAYIDQEDKFTGPPPPPNRPRSRYVELENRLTARHSGSFGWVHKFPRKVNFGMAYYFAYRLHYWNYQEINFRLGKSFILRDLSFNVAALYQRSINGDPILHYNNQYDDRGRFYAEASVRF